MTKLNEMIITGMAITKIWRRVHLLRLQRWRQLMAALGQGQMRLAMMKLKKR